jgi:hypothetical protein
MTRQEEIAFEKKAEKHFRGQRELPNGKSIWFNTHYDPVADRKYKANYDNIKWDSRRA